MTTKKVIVITGGGIGFQEARDLYVSNESYKITSVHM